MGPYPNLLEQGTHNRQRDLCALAKLCEEKAVRKLRDGHFHRNRQYRPSGKTINAQFPLLFKSFLKLPEGLSEIKNQTPSMRISQQHACKRILFAQPGIPSHQDDEIPHWLVFPCGSAKYHGSWISFNPPFYGECLMVARRISMVSKNVLPYGKITHSFS